jgi:hypothetical protein
MQREEDLDRPAGMMGSVRNVLVGTARSAPPLSAVQPNAPPRAWPYVIADQRRGPCANDLAQLRLRGRRGRA